MSHLQKHFHFHFFRKKLRKEKPALYFAIAIKSFALSLISIFVPVYLYKIGYSIKEIAFFFLIFSFFSILFSLLGAKIGEKLGVKIGMLLGNIFLVISYLLISLIPRYSFLFYIAPIFFGSYLTLFFVNFHVDMANNIKRKKITTEIGMVSVIVSLLCALAPFFGGLIANFSFPLLFSLSAFLLIGSLLPLFFAKGIVEKTKFSLREVFSFSTFFRIVPSIGVGAEIIIAFVIWPIFISFFFNLPKIGLLTSAMSFLSAGVIFFISKLSDKYGRNKILAVSSIVNVLHWPIRVIKNLMTVMGIHLAYGMIDAATKLPYTAKTYELGKKGREMNVIVFREFFIQVGRLLAAFLLFIFPSFVFAFLLGMLAAFMQFFFIFDKKTK